MPDSLAILGWWFAFGGSHIGLSSISVRRPLVEKLGERGFMALYSLISLATFVPLVRAYWGHRHGGAELWRLQELPGVRELAILIAGLAVIALALSFVSPSPLGMGPGASPRPRGITRITRHPLMTSFGLWAFAHLLVNGWANDVAFFGGFLVFSLLGAAHQDARKRALDDGSLREFFAESSQVPFAAILAGRTRLVLGEISWIGAALGLAAAVGLFYLHDVWRG